MAGDIRKQLRDTRYPGQMGMRLAAADEIDRLTELAYAPDGKEMRKALFEEAEKRGNAEAEVARLSVLVERQNALLRPFVAVANDYKDDAKDAWFVPCPLGACREARKAVSSVEKLSDC